MRTEFEDHNGVTVCLFVFNGPLIFSYHLERKCENQGQICVSASVYLTVPLCSVLQLCESTLGFSQLPTSRSNQTPTISSDNLMWHGTVEASMFFHVTLTPFRTLHCCPSAVKYTVRLTVLLFNKGTNKGTTSWVIQQGPAKNTGTAHNNNKDPLPTEQHQSQLDTRTSKAITSTGENITWITRAVGAAILVLTLLPMTT